MSQPAVEQVHKRSQQEEQADSNASMYVWVFGGVVFGFIAWAFCPNESLWIKILFSLPLITQVMGGYFHVKKHVHEDPFFYYFSMVLSNVCLIAYCFLWVCYRNNFKAYMFFSVFALVVVAGIIICVGVMMSAFLKEPDKEKHQKLWKLRKGVEHEPLWAMSFLFFVIFLDVTYLFGFAFAFHDRACLNTGKQVPALRMVNYDSPDDVNLTSPTVVVNNEGAKTKDLANPDGDKVLQTPNVDSNNDIDTSFYFYFNSGEAQLALSEGSPLNDCGLQKAASSGTPSPTPTPIEPPQRKLWLNSWVMNEKSRASFNGDFNRCSLERIKRRIEQESVNGRQARVVLIGQSDTQPLESLIHYKSNYELSEARAENVKYGITEALKTERDSRTWHNLEWLTLPSSDESRADPILACILNRWGQLNSQKNQLTELNKRVVAALVVPVEGDLTALQVKRENFRQLDLMDYMYFSIYTITTTGYGDIIPTTGYSKFVISIANICEVLFLVVFFNALVSIKADKKHVEMTSIIGLMKAQMERSQEDNKVSSESKASESGT
jgi:hypothetical protein